MEYALEFAGENRGELEKVLEHYNDSGLKQDAARFLIENMPRYFSYEGWQLIVTEWLPTSGYEYADKPDIEVYLNPDPQNAQYEVWIPIVK